jgi:hypothetical protein
MDYFQEIDNYIWGNLSPDEMKAFELRMKEDNALLEKVAMQRRELELISKMEEAYWLKEMKIWKEEAKDDKKQEIQGSARGTTHIATEALPTDKAVGRSKGTVLKRILPWSVAATVAILIGFFWLLPADPSFSAAQQAVIPAQIKSIERSSEAEAQDTHPNVDLFIAAYERLQEQQYSLADGAFQKIENDPQVEAWLLEAVEYNRALIRFELGSPQEARARLEKIGNNPSHRYRRKAKRLLKRFPN